MPRVWSAKRERQYEQIKEGLKDKGRSEEIAARTVNKERARSEESKEKSIEGRSSMTKAELERAVGRQPARASSGPG